MVRSTGHGARKQGKSVARGAEYGTRGTETGQKRGPWCGVRDTGMGHGDGTGGWDRRMGQEDGTRGRDTGTGLEDGAPARAHAVGVISGAPPTAVDFSTLLIINTIPQHCAVGITHILTPTSPKGNGPGAGDGTRGEEND